MKTLDMSLFDFFIELFLFLFKAYNPTKMNKNHCDSAIF